MPLEERLDLDIAEALAGVDRIEEALTGSAQTFKVALAEALDVLSSVSVESADASAVTTSLDEAIAAADLEPVLDADAGAVTTALDEAVAAADVGVEPEVTDVLGTELITSGIDEAIAAADTTVPIDGEVGDLTSSIDEAIRSADTLLEIETDASGVTDAIEEAVAAADTSIGVEGFTALGAGAEAAEERVGELVGQVGLLGAATRAGAGDIGALGGALGGMGTAGAAAAAGIGAAAFAGKEFFDAALGAQTATQRFNDVFGDLAERVDTIDIPGLNTDLSALAITIGADDDALRVAAAAMGELGLASGKSAEDVAATSQQLLLLAARISVVNPGLGTAEQIVERLGPALARGGRFASQFGLDLDANAVKARAVKDAHGDLAAATDQYALRAAGAAIATEQLGDRLGRELTEGADKPIVKLRSLQTQLSETFEEAGGPLVDPLIDSLEAVSPLLEAVAKLLGVGLTVAAKAVQVVMFSLEPAIRKVGEGAEFVQDVLGAFTIDNLKKVLRELIELYNKIPLLPDISTKFLDEEEAADKAAGGLDRHGDAQKRNAGEQERLAAQTARLREELLKTADQLLQLNGAGSATEVAFARVGPSFQSVIDLFTRGNVTMGEFGTAVHTTGLSADELIAVFGEVNTAVRQFVDNAVGELPGFTKALDDLAANDSLDVFLANVEQQVTDAATFLDNINRLLARGAVDLAATLFQRGQAAATAAREAAALSDQQLAKAEGDLDRQRGIDKQNVGRAEELGRQLIGTQLETTGGIEAVATPDIAAAIGRAEPPAVAVMRAISNTLSSVLGFGGRESGEAFGTGLEGGIRDSEARAAAAAARVAQRVISIMRSALLISSPSRVSREMGEFFVEGFAQGLSDVDVVEREAATLAERVNTAFAEALAIDVPGPDGLAEQLARATEGLALTIPAVVEVGDLAATVAVPQVIAARVPQVVVRSAAEPFAASPRLHPEDIATLASAIASQRVHSITVNEVAQDPTATAFAVAVRLGDLANR